jgi:SIR2-like domain
VFIVRGDLRRLVCDGWLMPASRDGRPESKWLRPGAPEPPWPDPPTDFRRGPRRVLNVPDWPADKPRPWLVNLDTGPDAPADWFLDGVRQFLAAAGPAAENAPVTGRGTPLLALPIINNAPEPLRPDAARIVAGLLPLLLEAVRPGTFDVALVAHDGPAFAAAQAAREQAGGDWPGLGDRLRARADELARFATRGDLALFLGAGVSAGAGLPLWGEMLDRLARRAGMDDRDRTGLRKLPALDQAAVIERRLGGPDELRAAVRDLSSGDHYGLTHALLATLPVRETVTTNYDELFELAWEARGRKPSVLPYRLRPNADAWVLKMHGSVSHPEDIVLTREHQLAYEERHAALAGIVQTLLLTRHMLFVGFSLSDDNFHRIADDVRRVLRSLEADGKSESPVGKPFGTAVVLRRRRLVEELWGDDLRWVGVGRPADRGRAPARRLEVFLDYLLAQTRDTAHLLDRRYERLLDGGERALREALQAFVESVPAGARESAAWPRVERFLAGLGYADDAAEET